VFDSNLYEYGGESARIIARMCSAIRFSMPETLHESAVRKTLMAAVIESLMFVDCSMPSRISPSKVALK